MISKILFSILITFTLLNMQLCRAQGGHDVGNGGDTYALEFVSIGNDILKHWHELDFTQGAAISQEQFQNAVQKMEVHSTSEKLVVRGFEVDAKNYPFCSQPTLDHPCGLILLNRTRWKDLDRDLVRKVALVFHEILGVMGMNASRFDDFYEVSGKKFDALRAFFNTRADIDLSYVCLLQRWNSSQGKVETLSSLESDQSLYFMIQNAAYEIELSLGYEDLFSRASGKRLSYALYSKKRDELPDHQHPLSRGEINFTNGKRSLRILQNPELQLVCYRVFDQLKTRP